MSDYVHESCCRQVAELRTEIERLTEMRLEYLDAEKILFQRIDRLTAENRRYEKYIDIQANEILEHEQTIATLKGVLDRLARLGNEPHYGNSDGNVIAQKALAATEQGESDV